MMFEDSLPGIKRFLAGAARSAARFGLLSGLMAAFVTHFGRMSASAAAGAVRTRARHRAAVIRFLDKAGITSDWSVLSRCAELLLAGESARAGWVFIVDQTLCSQQGAKTENTVGHGNFRPRSRKSARHQKKWARRSCHTFVMGLLLTPGGLRLPCFRSHRTRDCCRERGLDYRTQTQLAAELIRNSPAPDGPETVMLGDTSFDAAVIRAACRDRGWTWIVPVNPERMLAGARPRRRVSSLAEGLDAEGFAPVRLVPGKGRRAAQRRAARCRTGPRSKTRTYYVHGESRDVRSVGRVQLVFSTTGKPEHGRTVRVQKTLMTNGLSLSAAEVAELYDLRWQIELFFKEIKGTLGMHRYRFRRFAKVEAWTAVCLLTFVYLEWRRAVRLRSRGLADEDRDRWRAKRTHALCAAVRQAAEGAELSRLAGWTRTRGGLRRLKRALRAAVPREYREAG
jgi:hypothetical protein